MIFFRLLISSRQNNPLYFFKNAHAKHSGNRGNNSIDYYTTAKQRSGNQPNTNSKHYKIIGAKRRRGIKTGHNVKRKACSISYHQDGDKGTA